MKNAVLRTVCYYLFVFMTFYSCGLNSRNSVKEFIPGTYARSFEGAFSRGKEWLEIKNFSGATYTILRIVNYQRMEKDKLLPAQQNKEQLTAVYDGSSGTLKETKKGLTISFNPSKNSLLIGSAVFEKIK